MPTQTFSASPTFCRLLPREFFGQTSLGCTGLQSFVVHGACGFSERITERPVQFSTAQPPTFSSSPSIILFLLVSMTDFVLMRPDSGSTSSEKPGVLMVAWQAAIDSFTSGLIVSNSAIPDSSCGARMLRCPSMGIIPCRSMRQPRSVCQSSALLALSVGGITARRRPCTTSTFTLRCRTWASVTGLPALYTDQLPLVARSFSSAQTSRSLLPASRS